MKVLQINNFHYIRGGSDRVYFETSELLKQAGHEVIHFASHDDKNLASEYSSYFPNGADYSENGGGILTKLQLAKNFIYNANAVNNLKRLLHDFKPDIAHLHIFQSRLSSGIIKTLESFNIPTVMSVHEYKMLCPVYTFIDGQNNICEACQGKYYYNAFFKKCNDNSTVKSLLSAIESYVRDWYIPYVTNIDHFIMVSNFIRDIHVKYDDRFAAKSTVLYNFINTAVYQPHIKQGEYFIYFGRLSKEKGVSTLIKAFKKMPGIKLKIVGSGPQRPELESMVQGTANNIEFLGFQSGDDLLNLIKNSSFVIVPSEWYENNPMSVIEAFALGKPVIGTKIGGIPELITNEYNGLIVEPDNAEQLEEVILKANDMPAQLYNAMATNARAFAQQHFDKDQHLEKLLNIYSNTITNKT